MTTFDFQQLLNFLSMYHVFTCLNMGVVLRLQLRRLIRPLNFSLKDLMSKLLEKYFILLKIFLEIVIGR